MYSPARPTALRRVLFSESPFQRACVDATICCRYPLVGHIGLYFRETAGRL